MGTIIVIEVLSTEVSCLLINVLVPGSGVSSAVSGSRGADYLPPGPPRQQQTSPDPLQESLPPYPPAGWPRSRWTDRPGPISSSALPPRTSFLPPRPGASSRRSSPDRVSGLPCPWNPPHLWGVQPVTQLMVPALPVSSSSGSRVRLMLIRFIVFRFGLHSGRLQPCSRSGRVRPVGTDPLAQHRHGVSRGHGLHLPSGREPHHPQRVLQGHTGGGLHHRCRDHSPRRTLVLVPPHSRVRDRVRPPLPRLRLPGR